MSDTFVISLQATYIDRLTQYVQSHAEMLEHPCRGEGDLVHVFCAQLLIGGRKGQPDMATGHVLAGGPISLCYSKGSNWVAT
jgi:hypothetical protein